MDSSEVKTGKLVELELDDEADAAVLVDDPFPSTPFVRPRSPPLALTRTSSSSRPRPLLSASSASSSAERRLRDVFASSSSMTPSGHQHTGHDDEDDVFGIQSLPKTKPKIPHVPRVKEDRLIVLANSPSPANTNESILNLSSTTLLLDPEDSPGPAGSGSSAAASRSVERLMAGVSASVSSWSPLTDWDRLRYEAQALAGDLKRDAGPALLSETVADQTGLLDLLDDTHALPPDHLLVTDDTDKTLLSSPKLAVRPLKLDLGIGSKVPNEAILVHQKENADPQVRLPLDSPPSPCKHCKCVQQSVDTSGRTEKERVPPVSPAVRSKTRPTFTTRPRPLKLPTPSRPEQPKTGCRPRRSLMPSSSNTPAETKPVPLGKNRRSLASTPVVNKNTGNSRVTTPAKLPGSRSRPLPSTADAMSRTTHNRASYSRRENMAAATPISSKATLSHSKQPLRPLMARNATPKATPASKMRSAMSPTRTPQANRPLAAGSETPLLRRQQLQQQTPQSRASQTPRVRRSLLAATPSSRVKPQLQQSSLKNPLKVTGTQQKSQFKPRALHLKESAPPGAGAATPMVATQKFAKSGKSTTESGVGHTTATPRPALLKGRRSYLPSPMKTTPMTRMNKE